jgi:hypothetical protein
MIFGGKFAKSSNHHALLGRFDFIVDASWISAQSGTVIFGETLVEKEILFAKLLLEEDSGDKEEEVMKFKSEFLTNFAINTQITFSKKS